jgi:hypothetical protein
MIERLFPCLSPLLDQLFFYSFPHLTAKFLFIYEKTDRHQMISNLSIINGYDEWYRIKASDSLQSRI